MFVCSTSSDCLDPIIFAGQTQKEVLLDVLDYWYDELLNYQDMDMDPETLSEFSQLAKDEDVELNSFNTKVLLANLGIGFSMVEV